MPEAALAATTHKRLAPHSDIARMNSAYIKRQVGVSAKDFKEREVCFCVSGNLSLLSLTSISSLTHHFFLSQDIKSLLDKLDKEHALLETVNKVSGKLMERLLAESELSDEILVCTSALPLH